MESHTSCVVPSVLTEKEQHIYFLGSSLRMKAFSLGKHTFSVISTMVLKTSVYACLLKKEENTGSYHFNIVWLSLV